MVQPSVWSLTCVCVEKEERKACNDRDDSQKNSGDSYRRCVLPKLDANERFGASFPSVHLAGVAKERVGFGIMTNKIRDLKFEIALLIQLAPEYFAWVCLLH
jgi:hypothetical protein